MNEQDPQNPYQSDFEPQPQPAPKRKRTWLWVIAGVVAFLMLLGAITGGEDDKAEANAPKPAVVTETVTASPDPVQNETVEEEAVEEDTIQDPAEKEQKVQAKPKPKPKAATYRMPDLRGKNLQFAQDTIQAVSGNPFFFTDSVDATGLNRFQMLDSAWTVCGSTPKPNDVFTDNTMVTFSVVKDTESC